VAYRETKVVKRIPGASGKLIDKTGTSVKVRFSLIQHQDYVDGIPTLSSADGTIEFKDQHQAWAAMDGELRTLEGGGIQASVYIASMDTFKVTGPVNEI
jgi:hypothetical protein